MSKIILSSIEQPMARPAPKNNIYEARQVDPGRIRAQVQAGPEIRNEAAAGLISLAQGLSAWTGVARAWSRREEQPETGAASGRASGGRKSGEENDSPVPSLPDSRSHRAVKHIYERDRAGLAEKAEPGPEPDPAGENRALDLDRAGLLEAIRLHDSALAGFNEKQAELKGPQAIGDPRTGQPGLVDRTRQWIKEYEQKAQPKFRQPLTEEIYKGIVSRGRERMLAQSELRQAEEEKAWQEQVFETDLDLMVETMFQDPAPERLTDLEAEIETLWPGPEAAERRLEMRDRSYGRIAEKMLESGDLNETEAFVHQYQDRFKPETVERLKKDLDRKEAELVLSHTALTEVLPDLAADELGEIMSSGAANSTLDGLYQSAEKYWGLSSEKTLEYRWNREEAQAAREWLDRPEHSFKSFDELLDQAGREFKNLAEDRAGLNRHRLVEEELRRRREEFNRDPIGQVSAQRDTLLDRLLAKGGLSGERPAELMQMKIALGRSLAKKMGMEERGLVLSMAEVAEYRNQLAQTNDLTERLELLTEYDRSFGRYAGRAFEQLGLVGEDRLAARLNQHPDPTVRELAALGLDDSAPPAEPWLQSLAQKEADDSPYARELRQRLIDSAGADDQALEDLAALRNLAGRVAAAGLAQGHPRPGRLALKLVNALSDQPCGAGIKELAAGASVSKDRPPEEPKSMFGSVMHSIADIASGIGHGVVEGIREANKTIGDINHWLKDNNIPIFPNPILAANALHEAVLGEDHLDFENPVKAPDTAAGNAVSKLSQFLTGFVAGGPALKGAKAASAIGKAAKAFLQGGIADFAFFDPHEERLSNLIQEVPALANPINEYLAADGDDSRFEGRMKNFIEGLGLGLATEGVAKAFTAGLRVIKNVRAAKAAAESSPEAAEAVFRAMDEASGRLDAPAGIGNNVDPGAGRQGFAAEPNSGENLSAVPFGTVDGAKLGRVEAPHLISAPENLREQYTPLVNELIERNVKVSPDQVLRVEKASYYMPEFKDGEWVPKKMSEDSIIFIERGSPKAGLEHIRKNHGSEFDDNFGPALGVKNISDEQLAEILLDVVKNGKIVAYQFSGKLKTPRPVYQHTINGYEVKIAITVGDNGYIVGANPWSKLPE